MSNLHRIRWIDAQIHEKVFPNCRTIADRFEISSRQASRDVEYIRYSLGAPIAYSSEKNGYYYTDSGFELPPHFISDEEKQALSYLAYKYGEVGNEQASRLAGLFSRLTGNDLVSKGSSDSLPVYVMQGKETVIFNRLKKASSESEKVEMEYINARNELNKRIICPYKLFTVKQITYIVGYCELRQEIRVFNLSRIRSIRGTGTRFEMLSTFRPEDYSDESSLSRMEPYLANIKFSTPPDTGLYKLDIVSVKDSVYKISFHDSAEILSMLLMQRCNFAILSPNWLRERLLKRISHITENNS